MPSFLRVLFSLWVALALSTAAHAGETIYVDVPDMPERDILAVMKWIKNKTTGERLPFCWRRSYGRGVGKPLSTCRGGKEKSGLICYPKCKPGYKGVGPVCWQKCKKGFTDTGAHCLKPKAYGRGAGFPWKFGDKIGSLDGARKRCRKKHGSCEKHGAIIYPKCKSGYDNVGCCICSPKCTGMGLDIGMSCQKKSYGRGVGSPMKCKPGEDEDAGLCYKKCRSGYKGVGPVCWQKCPRDWVNCGAGCAKTSAECAMVVTDQVLAPIVVTANIATLGLSTPATGAAKAGTETLKIGGKVLTSGTRVGKVFIKSIKTLQSVRPAGLAKNATLVKRIYAARAGTALKKTITLGKTAGVTYKAASQFSEAFADDFANQTSREIAREIDRRFHPRTARFLKGYWGNIQFREMAAANGMQIAQTVMTVISIVDISGVTGLVNAYTKPICQKNIGFPKLSRDYSATSSRPSSPSPPVRPRRSTGVTAAKVLGTYERRPVENKWHRGTISQKGNQLVWRNQAGVSWTLRLDPRTGYLRTDPSNPYFKTAGVDRRDFKLQMAGGRVTAFVFQGESYTRAR